MAGKEKKIAVSMVAGQGQRRGHADVTGFGFDCETDKTQQGIDTEDARCNASVLEEEAAKIPAFLYTKVRFFRCLMDVDFVPLLSRLAGMMLILRNGVPCHGAHRST